ncbi:MAG: helix-turn-helix transcriptional regulator [Flavobacteriales bacterium]
MKPTNVHTARLFKSVRERMGLSIRAIAQRLRVSIATVSRIESGHFAPSVEVAQRLVALSGEENLEKLFIDAYR